MALERSARFGPGSDSPLRRHSAVHQFLQQSGSVIKAPLVGFVIYYLNAYYTPEHIVVRCFSFAECSGCSHPASKPSKYESPVRVASLSGPPSSGVSEGKGGGTPAPEYMHPLRIITSH